MSKFPRSVFILAAALALHNANGGEVNVYAAASLTDVMKEIAVNYEKHSGDKVVFNFAASSLLARQIAEGAPADIFFSADEAKMDGLETAGLIVTATRRDLLSNSPVIVVPNDSKLRIASPDELITTTQKISIADPRAVPAGIKCASRPCGGRVGQRGRRFRLQDGREHFEKSENRIQRSGRKRPSDSVSNCNA